MPLTRCLMLALLLTMPPPAQAAQRTWHGLPIGYWSGQLRLGEAPSAARLLGQSGWPGAGPLLRDWLGREMDEGALRAGVRGWRPPAEGILLAHVQSLGQEILADEDARPAALHRLAALGEAARAAAPSLLRLYRANREADTREAVLRTLLQVAPEHPDTRDLLREGLRDPHPAIRQAAVILWCQQDPRRVLDPLLLAQLRDADLRQLVTPALGQLPGPLAGQAAAGVVAEITSAPFQAAADPGAFLDVLAIAQGAGSAAFLGALWPPILQNAGALTEEELRRLVFVVFAHAGNSVPGLAENLAALLDQPKADVRTMALQILAKMGAAARPALPAVIRHFPTATGEIQRLASLEVLGALGPAAREAVPLIQGQPRQESSMVAACALALARIDRREARQLAPLLAAALARGAPAQEAPMLQALRDLGPEAADAVPAVVRVLQRNAAGRRGEAVATLAAIGPAAAAAVGPLQVALDDPKATDEERVAVIQALAKIGPVATAGPILERVVAGPDPFLTLVAAAGLDRLRPQTPYPEGRWKAWVEAATRHDRATRKPAPVYPNSSRDNGGHFFTPLLQAVDAAHTLSPAAGPWLAPVVALALNRPSTEDWTLWEDAVKIAPRFGPAVKPAAPALVDDFLRHQGPVGRPEQLLEYPPAVPALVALGPETAIPALAARLGRAAEPDFNLPLAFALFGAPAVRPLMDLLDDEERCLGAVTALGYLGDAARPAVPALGALTRHEEFAVRRAAVTALLRIDPAAVPPLP